MQLPFLELFILCSKFVFTFLVLFSSLLKQLFFFFKEKTFFKGKKQYNSAGDEFFQLLYVQRRF